MKPERQRAWRRGRKAESLALLALRLVGYRILARDHRTAPGEIDIIARRGTILAFIEVKARADVTRRRNRSSPASAGGSPVPRRDISPSGRSFSPAAAASTSCW
jgi:Predicted endonuclease distantly related to archaeal Holliday junction resolvase